MNLETFVGTSSKAVRIQIQTTLAALMLPTLLQLRSDSHRELQH